MKKFCTVLLMFWITACNVVPASPQNSMGTPAITQTSPTVMLPVTPTASMVAGTAIPEATPLPTQATVFPPTLVIPTLKGGSPAQLSSIQMIDTQIGWAIELAPEIIRPNQTNFWMNPWQPEGYVLRTSDGGKTWQNVTPPTGAYSPGGFFALDANNAWASDNVPCCISVTDTSIWHTTDGGITWQPSQPFSILPNDSFYLPFRMQFIDQNTGWLLAWVEAGMSAGRGHILFHTTDGGETWTPINLHNLTGCWSVGFVFLDSTTGWYGENCFSQGVIYEPLDVFIVQGWGQLRTTVDGGYTFDDMTRLPMPAELQQPELATLDAECNETRIFSIASDTVGVEWGCNIYTNGMKYRYFFLTNDSGRTWNSWEAAGNEYFFDATHGWRVLSPGELQQTTDAGLNWVTIKPVAWEEIQFDFVSEQEGWALASSGDVTALVHTTDGGHTWEEIKPMIQSR